MIKFKNTKRSKIYSRIVENSVQSCCNLQQPSLEGLSSKPSSVKTHPGENGQEREHDPPDTSMSYGLLDRRTQSLLGKSALRIGRLELVDIPHFTLIFIATLIPSFMAALLLPAAVFKDPVPLFFFALTF
ncbi:hypothetical protein CEXT_424661 [Caerostris extrusa]|uniref:Uncharacterized protein n=1 Tax=Caerostris extrusa TaxID=172846 RepID=A0AAV4V507_CAEEX|nr:hypothetical protein CEXT_424661 [Caerostris extrusa]